MNYLLYHSRAGTSLLVIEPVLLNCRDCSATSKYQLSSKIDRLFQSYVILSVTQFSDMLISLSNGFNHVLYWGSYSYIVQKC